MAKPRLRSTDADSVMTSPEPRQGMVQPSGRAIAPDAISKRAYELWLERGCPGGSPEEDWYKAELELAAHGQPAEGAASHQAGATAVAGHAGSTD